MNMLSITDALCDVILVGLTIRENNLIVGIVYLNDLLHLFNKSCLEEKQIFSVTKKSILIVL